MTRKPAVVKIMLLRHHGGNVTFPIINFTFFTFYNL